MTLLVEFKDTGKNLIDFCIPDFVISKKLREIEQQGYKLQQIIKDKTNWWSDEAYDSRDTLKHYIATKD